MIIDYHIVMYFLVIIHFTGFVEVKLSENILKNFQSYHFWMSLFFGLGGGVARNLTPIFVLLIFP